MYILFALFLAVTLSPVAIAEAKILITVNKSTQRMTVSADGAPLYNWQVSTGRLGHDTPSGEHRAFRMEKDHYSREWDDAPMPHSIFFTREGHAIHGTSETGKIGSPASAGCVRLTREHAATLFSLVEEKGVLNTSVKIVGDLRVALGRSNTRPVATETDQTIRPTRRSGLSDDPVGRPGEARQGYYIDPYSRSYSRWPPSPYYAPPPPSYYERQPYPRYYRW